MGRARLVAVPRVRIRQRLGAGRRARPWRGEGRDSRSGTWSRPARFTAAERPELWVDKAFVEGVLRGEHEAALVCASPPQEFTGEVVTRKRAGHIPGSSSAPAARLVDRDDRTYLEHDKLRGILEPALGAPRIVTYCGGGIAAASAALALTLLGESRSPCTTGR